jgi:hypothetical protein
VAQATTGESDMPNIKSFDMTLGKSTTPVVRDAGLQSVANFSTHLLRDNSH